MEKWKSASKKTSAFTIVELLTVMAVIAILIGLLVPALGLVKDFAKEIEQKAQLHGIEVAIDMFTPNSGYGTYPPSDENGLDLNPPAALGLDPAAYGGAQKLADALVGQDLLGYHPRSGFRSDLMGFDTLGNPQQVYNVGTRQNLEARVGPFIDLENANAFRMGDIYRNIVSPLPGGTFFAGSYVLCDVFAKKRTGMGVQGSITYGGMKTGMPLLYYRARTEYYEQDFGVVQSPGGPDGIDDDVYYYRDNMHTLALGHPEYGPALPHILDGSNNAADWQRFEEMILNDKITTMRRPYRANSFILISAGKDGLYGTGDDVTNVTKTKN